MGNLGMPELILILLWPFCCSVRRSCPRSASSRKGAWRVQADSNELKRTIEDEMERRRRRRRRAIRPRSLPGTAAPRSPSSPRDRTTGRADPEDQLPRMTFLEHLEDLRKRLVWSAVGSRGFLVCWFWAKEIFHVLSGRSWHPPAGTKLAYTQLTSRSCSTSTSRSSRAFSWRAPSSLSALALRRAGALPPREAVALPFVFFSVICFVGGGYFGYKVAFPWWRSSSSGRARTSCPS